MENKFIANEMLSSLTHLIATLLSIAGLATLVTFAAIKGNAVHVVGFSIFGASLVLLYLVSTLYHFLSKNHPAKKIFQIMDHVMIYVLIAGTYVPLTLIILPPAWGWSMFGIIWGLAIMGIIIKFLKFKGSLLLSTTLYLIMGWIIVIAINPLYENLSSEGLFWLVIGGIFYTIGTIFFAIDKIFPTQKWYSLHDVFHIFVMLGSLSHFWFMMKFVLP